jgi:hypothetical protein
MFAYDYPLLGIFWSLCIFAMLTLWVFAVIWVFIDNFQRKDHGGMAKALWTLGIIFLPVFGVLAYLISRPIDPYIVVTEV